MKPRLHYLSLLLAVTAAPAFAQQQPIDSVRTLHISEVVVTATRSETDKSKTPQSINVISQKDIQLTGAQEFTDLIKKNSSVNVIQYPGLSAGVSIRGFRPQFSGLNQRTLLLVDGRPAGTTNLATINPSNIDRIEVLKGPASALYGSQAMGGVVNIITKKSQGSVKTSLFAEYGSFETLKLGGATGGNITEKLDFDLSFLSFDRSKNYKLGDGNLFRDWLDADKARKKYANEDPAYVDVDDTRGDGERRDYTRLSYNTGSLRLGYQLNDNWRVDLKGERFLANNVETASDIDAGNSQPGRKDIDRYNSELSIAGNVAGHQLLLRGYAAEETSDTYNLYTQDWTTGETSPIASYRSYRSSSEWKGLQLKDVYEIGRHTITAGIDYTNATAKSRSFSVDGNDVAPYNPNYSLISTGIYVQGQLSFLKERLIITPGARYDFITFDIKNTPLLTKYVPGKETNPFFSPSLGVQFQFTEPLTVHATAGRAFVTPDAYNVAGYSVASSANGASVTYGNPNLENENSITWDAGLRFQKLESGFSADVTYFSTHIKDRITKTSPVAAANGETVNGQPIISSITYTNANKADIRGLEIELGYDFGALSDYQYSLRLFANNAYNFTAEEVTINADGSETKKDIYNVADLVSSYGLEYNNLKGLNLRLNGRYVGYRKDTDFNDPAYPEIKYPPFMVMDFSASYTYAKRHSLTLFVKNLTDENYYEKRGFNLLGRNYALRYGINF
ncbi:TonB-dependent receptor [Pontibacter silvestris]|uniref:TonB-dependent receptor n=1 Tax=Pontibacter silvestris TaxID=2305183 RepID=A0ABW4WZG3_9BACT|nr:TonB-dependent receptor [Pontibacter silvestris]MCC9138210.1 TonB-dependent receptor [Pontibacter silvestris]